MERVALIEVLDQERRVVDAVPVWHWPVTVGRALDCDVVLHDPYVAAHHLTLDLAPEGSPGLVLTVGETVNGVQLKRQPLSSGSSTVLRDGFEFDAGRSTVRVRLAGESLAAERPLPHRAERAYPALTIGGLAMLMLWVAALLWLRNLPGSAWDKYLPPLLGVMLAVAAWCSLWGLGSKLFQRRFRFMPHLRVLLGFLLAMLSLDALLALGSFALALPWLSHIRSWVQIAMVFALLGTHFSLLLPGHPRAVALTFGALCLLAIGLDGALNWRRHQRLFDELYAATLPPPSLRLVRAEPVARLLDDLRPLRPKLEERAREDESTDAGAER
jgi:FHA domain